LPKDEGLAKKKDINVLLRGRDLNKNRFFFCQEIVIFQKEIKTQLRNKC
jgi:hypothetical protein